jgi:hypothetical protein
MNVQERCSPLGGEQGRSQNRGRIMRTCMRWMALGLILLVPVTGHAQYAGDEIGDRWLPSFDMAFAVHSQTLETSGWSSLGYTASDTTNVLTSLFGIDAGLATPVLIDRFGAPRIFGSIGVQFPMSNDFPVLNRTASFAPLDPLTPTVCPVGEIAGDPAAPVASCDQELKVDMNLKVNWLLGAGVDFTLPIHERKIYVRTGVQYLGQKLEFSGFASRNDRASGQGNNTQPGTVLRELTICCATGSKNLHAIGPSLGINADAAHVGPVALHVFAQLNTFWYVNPGAIEFGTSTASGDAEYSVRPQPFVAQGLAGLRIVWKGK